ncbi:hypothetical protein PGSY75_1430000 [Plasmodium gaboni]|uniref:Ion transport domain-containing protein n=1 Tax=Plasmodium gaboni TaxID=647221 RepID=A0A151LAM1_9APIC|nr:hypothetical protein PGSY75_1430000 [Plasmodium gaboni]KYN95896.1 hypothetical protein PGSY75_1430000 [Plasmodium gaboni]
MDNFIDDEINLIDENEPILIDIQDLIKSGKVSKKKGNGQHVVKNYKKNDEKVNKYKRNDYVNINNKINNYKINHNYEHNNIYESEIEDYNDKDFLIYKDGNIKKRKDIKLKEYSEYSIFYYSNNIYNSFKNNYEKIFDKLKKKYILGKKKKKTDDKFMYYSENLSDDFFHILASRLYYSKITTYIYFMVIILNLIILIYTIFTNVLNKYVVCAEIFVIFMLFIEIFLRLLTEGTSYFYNFDGLFDVTVSFICLLLLLNSGDFKIFFLENKIVKTNKKEIEEIISQSLTVLRFSFQLFRTITFFMHYKRTKLPTDNIDFSLLNLPRDDI